MGSNHYFHPEFGWLAPSSRFRRELRIGFFSMLFGLSIGAMAVGALSVGSRNAANSEARVAARASIPTQASPSGADNKRREAASLKIDSSDPIKWDTDGSQRDSGRKNAGTACVGDKVGCLENTRHASGRTGAGSPAANDEPAIARVPLGHADASTGMIRGRGRTDMATQGSLAPERKAPPTDRPNSSAMSRGQRADVRGSSSSPPGFWDWSR
jgi:hypothetical protein